MSRDVQVTCTAAKLNAAFKAAPEQVIDMLFRRVPVPEALKDYVPERDDGKMSVLGLINTCVLRDHALIGTFSSGANEGAKASDFTGFDLVKKESLLSDRTRYAGVENVPVYYISQELFNQMWDALAQYAPQEVLDSLKQSSDFTIGTQPLDNVEPVN